MVSKGKTGSISDGYHTFDELYAHRAELFITLCRTLILAQPLPITWRSKLHSDGSSYDGWFILGIGTKPGEQMTYHLPIDRWNDTDNCVYITFNKAPEFDGHTSKDVLERLKGIAKFPI